MTTMEEVQIPAGEILAMLCRQPMDLPGEEGPWPEQGTWTYEDYLRLPNDGRRYEIVEGVLYVSPVPRYLHQFIAGAIFALLWNHVREQRLGVVLPAPFEVHLSERSKPIQPDVTFIRGKNQPPIDAVAFEGAPDLVVEVLSPSSLHQDRIAKFAACEQAGVPEYWIVDPETRSLEIHVLQDGFYVLHDHVVNGQFISTPTFPALSVRVSECFPEAVA